MGRYDWPGSPPATSDDRLALRNSYFQRLWRTVADGFLTGAAGELYDALARLAEAAITEAEIDRKRWLPIGPSVILKGQASGKPRVAGRVRDIKRSPDGTRIYAASANGGVWFSGDGGLSWAPVGGMATTPDRNARGRSGNSLVIGCLHVEFGANADADTVYAGTGEPAYNYSDKGIPGFKSGGIGILKLNRTVTAALADPSGNPWDREAPNLTGAGIYRIVRDPDPAHEQLLAATTFGLFKRNGAFAANADWTRVAVPPFDVQNADRVFATDAAWVPAATAPAAAPARLFVAMVNLGDTNRKSGIYVSQAAPAAPLSFSEIVLPGYVNGKRLALAPVMPVAATPTTHPQIMYVLSGAKSSPQLWRVDATTAKVVRNLPPPLFGGTRNIGANARETNDQSWYDMAVAVDPSNPQQVFIGGSVEYGTTDWDASLYRGTVTGSAAADNFSFGFLAANNLTPNADASFIGRGVHADVHVVRVSDDGTNVWVGCDGGIFASASSGASLSFVARNTGLAVTECGFVASHPGHAGPVAAGTQDNGVIRRVGDTVWQYQSWGGDGGGVCFHPQAGREAFLMGQYTHVDWSGNGHFDPPIERAAFPGNVSPPPFAPERKRSLFYSGPATVPGATAGKARLAIGSYRLWLTDDWDPLSPAVPLMFWRTLPTARDPYATPAQLNFDQDKIDESAGNVISVKWLDRGTVNGTQFQNSKLLVLYERAIVRIYQVDGIDKWDHEILAWSKKKRISEDSDIPAGGAPSEKLPWLGAWSEIAVHRSTRDGDASFKGSFYVSTTGASTLTNTGITEAVRMDTLWWFDGHGKFYPSGLRGSGTKAPAFSVICDPENPDIVYVGTAMGVWRGTLTQLGSAAPAWTWVMFSIGLPEAFVQDLSIHWNPAAPNGGLKLLRAAIQSRGVWEVDISANPDSIGKSFLRVHPLDTRRITPTSLTNLTDESATPTPYPRCLSPDIAVVRPVPASWSGGTPTEADIVALTPNENLIGPPANRIMAQRVTAAAHSAFVLVHHRHTNAVPAAEVKVALLKRRMTLAERDGGDIALSTAWKTAIVNLLVNGQNVTLDDRWKRAGTNENSNPATNAATAANTVRSPAGPVEARMPRAAAFNLDMAGATVGQRYLLLAVMTSSRDPITAAELSGATVADIVLNGRHVCARVVYL